jgi:hypothetical protein
VDAEKSERVSLEVYQAYRAILAALSPLWARDGNDAFAVLCAVAATLLAATLGPDEDPQVKADFLRDRVVDMIAPARDLYTAYLASTEGGTPNESPPATPNGAD